MRPCFVYNVTLPRVFLGSVLIISGRASVCIEAESPESAAELLQMAGFGDVELVSSAVTVECPPLAGADHPFLTDTVLSHLREGL